MVGIKFTLSDFRNISRNGIRIRNEMDGNGQVIS